MVTFTGNSVGDTATYTCNSGFELIGNASVMCTPVDMTSATFSPAAPVCRCKCYVIMNTTTRCLCYHVHSHFTHCLHDSCSVALCPDPADIVNGMVTFTGNSVGDTAIYTCNSGFELIGNTSTTCMQVDMNIATFIAAAPVCRREYCVIMNRITRCLYYHEHCVPSHSTHCLHHSYFVALCPNPADIVNGAVTFTGNSVGDTATYTCSLNFELIGNAFVMCAEVDVDSATFSPVVPVCRRECCMNITDRCLIHVTMHIAIIIIIISCSAYTIDHASTDTGRAYKISFQRTRATRGCTILSRI